MIDNKEREEIINAAVEQTLLKLPEVVGNLIMNHAAKIEANKKFYDKYPEFKNHREVVASVIESIEDADDLFAKDFQAIMTEAVPKIRKRISDIGKLDVKKVEKPDLDFSHGEL